MQGAQGAVYLAKAFPGVGEGVVVAAKVQQADLEQDYLAQEVRGGQPSSVLASLLNVE